ncbi:MAG: hypothetical protein NC111_03545 [Bacteroides sp.]|nr:hypothetical protein [Bacteroides sp.]MCM1412918.1 hypothetical protein [Bacteroides sp.]MCM1471587.1 hypothetical protein [Bacteroides sp.]
MTPDTIHTIFFILVIATLVGLMSAIGACINRRMAMKHVEPRRHKHTAIK